MMSLRNPGRLAIQRRSAEIDFLQHLLRSRRGTALSGDEHAPNGNRPALSPQGRMAWQVQTRQRALADELLHTRQTEPLGEALQRRLAMAELICRELDPVGSASPQADAPPSGTAYRTAEIEWQALADMLQHWWAWLRRA
jgi:hypothetical protein